MVRPQRRRAFSTCLPIPSIQRPGPVHAPLRRLDAPPREAAMGDRPAAGDPGQLADGARSIATCAATSRSCCRDGRPAWSPSTSCATAWPGLQYLGVLVDVGGPDRLPARRAASSTTSRRACAAIRKTEVSDVRTGFAAERAFVEKHAGSPAGAGRSEGDPPAHRGPLALGVRQEDRHAARRRRAGAAARLLGHREEVRRPRFGGSATGGEPVLEPEARRRR